MYSKSPLTLELELWSLPGFAIPPMDGHQTAAECQMALGLPSGIVLGLSNIPDKTDCENLLLAFDGGEVCQSDFLSFCADLSLPQDIQNPESAAHFLSYSFGKSLAWLHIPATSEGALQAASIINWASKVSLCVVERTELYCLLKGVSVAGLFSRI